MCGRYTFFTDRELQEIDEIIEQISNDVQLEKMKVGEIFPTNIAPVLLPQDEIIIPRLMIWGFPHFQDKGVTINARSESVRDKKLFASSLERRRCVIPSTGFFEWDAAKKKYLFNMPGSQMLYMAGICNQFANEDRFVILTTEANHFVEEIHNRMPVVIPKDKIREWLFHSDDVDNILFGTHPPLEKQLIV